ncbi:MAG: lipopolysaccharide heptosyltransferase I [Planctomycetes bacterium]|nr:lipopolysaccharide heptosyltransferase I [Planctomycetota bacterium]
MPERILIIKPSALGDIVVALPAMAALRKTFPDAKIAWLVRTGFAPLLEDVEGLDEIIYFDRILLGKWWRSPHAFAELISFVKNLRKHRFDTVIDLQGLFRTALFAWLTGCKKRFGMATAREFATVFYTHKIEQDDDSVHVIDYNRKIVAAAGANADTVAYNLKPNKNALDEMTELLNKNNVNQNACAIIVIGSAHAAKCWPKEHFAELADRMAAKFDVKIVAVGTADEREAVRAVNDIATVNIVNLAGLTNLTQLIAILSKAKVVISNDTGPGHIASALDRPTVMIFGPTNPERIKPYNKKHSVAAVESDSWKHQIRSTNPKYEIQKITVDHVFRTVEFHINRSDPEKNNHP